MNAANAVTLIRIALVPCFGVLWWRGAHGLALAVFIVAALTDLLDGFLARVLDQRTRLGQFLDPAADKFMLLVSFLVAAALGVVPRWLAALAIGRDVVLTSGGALFASLPRLRGRLGPERWRPTRLGKYSTFSLLVTIGLALVWRLVGSESLRPFVGAMGVTAAALATISGIQYVVAGVRALRSDMLAGGEDE